MCPQGAPEASGGSKIPTFFLIGPKSHFFWVLRPNPGFGGLEGVQNRGPETPDFTNSVLEWPFSRFWPISYRKRRSNMPNSEKVPDFHFFGDSGYPSTPPQNGRSEAFWRGPPEWRPDPEIGVRGLLSGRGPNRDRPFFRGTGLFQPQTDFSSTFWSDLTEKRVRFGYPKSRPRSGPAGPKSGPDRGSGPPDPGSRPQIRARDPKSEPGTTKSSWGPKTGPADPKRSQGGPFWAQGRRGGSQKVPRRHPRATWEPPRSHKGVQNSSSWPKKDPFGVTWAASLLNLMERV